MNYMQTAFLVRCLHLDEGYASVQREVLLTCCCKAFALGGRLVHVKNVLQYGVGSLLYDVSLHLDGAHNKIASSVVVM